jgi:5-methyltetrahydropteroyltriglutamate--homocysteine methyltransferase
MVGCIDLSDMTIESPEKIASRVKRALPYVPKEDVILAPDCGMKYLPRDVAFGKMQAMVEAARRLRKEYGD